MQLKSTIKVPMSVRQAAAVDRIDSECFEGVKRKVLEEFQSRHHQVTDDYLQRGVLALKQYYVLPVFDPRNMHAVSDVIDPFWHAHILHTKQYATFCDEAIGSFMHHDPLDHGQVGEVSRVRFLYAYTREVMDLLFHDVDGDFYPERLLDSALVCTHGNDDYISLHEDEKFIMPRVDQAQPSFVF